MALYVERISVHFLFINKDNVIINLVTAKVKIFVGKISLFFCILDPLCNERVEYKLKVTMDECPTLPFSFPWLLTVGPHGIFPRNKRLFNYA